MLYMRATLNLRQVEAFYSVMQTGTVVAAARLMNVTQPVVSRAIALLEMRVGYKLFERHGRRLSPTPDAEVLYREIEPIYGGLDRIAEVAEDIRLQRAGAVRIATMPALSHGLVARAIAAFLAPRPHVTAFVQSMPSRQVAEAVATRQYDVGLVEQPLSRSAIAIEPLAPAPAMAVMPVGHRLARKRKVSVADLVGERLILLSQHGFLRFQIDDAFSRRGAAAHVVLETPNSLLACALVAAGAGMTIVSKWSAESFIGPRVVAKPMEETLTSQAALIFPAPGARLSLAEAFADALRQEARR
ncbi:LysR family transcriptional regulator [Bordetella bronchialis]